MLCLFFSLNGLGKKKSSSPQSEENLKKKQNNEENTKIVTDDDIGVSMIGGIIAKISKDFYEQASNKKSVLLLKLEGSLKSFKVEQSFSSEYEKKQVTFTLHHIYNKYHMMLRFGDEEAPQFLEIVRVGFSNKKAKKPKVKKKEPVKLFKGTFEEDGFSRDFEGGAGVISMTEGYRENIKKNLSTILMQASATPVVDNGEIIGFALEDIDEGIFTKAGFQDGDVVTSINGKPLNDAATAIKILNSLKESDDIQFDFLRGGQSYSVDVDVQ